MASVARNCRGLIGPSVLACDMSNLASECQRVIEGGAGFIHLDVMDGHFVPNLTFGAPIIKCLKKNVADDVILDVHLMVSKPSQWVVDVADAGGSAFTFHIEVEENVEELIQTIRRKNMRVGIALKPGTPVSAVLPYVDKVDIVLIMTVEPGFGGQSFMKDMLPKVAELRNKYPLLDIMVDGGIGPGNIDSVADAGANLIVAGTSVFKAPDAAVPIALLKK